MKLLSYLAFLACLEGLGFAVLVYWLNPPALLNRLGAAVGVLNAWWNGCLVVVYGSPDLNAALLFDRLSYLAILGLNPVLAWFYLRFAGASRRLIAWLVVLATVVAGVVAGAYLLGGFPHTGFVPGPWGNVAIEAPEHFWGAVSDVSAITLDLVYFVLLFRQRQTTASWRLKRLLTFILVGIVSAIGAYLVLTWVSDTFAVPGLIFLPAAVLTLLNFYVIAQYRFLQNQTPRLHQEWAEILPQAAFLLDKQARMVGANGRARSLVASPLFQEFPPAWEDRSQALPCEVDTPHGRVRLSPHFDRFGDFVGAVGLLLEEKPDEGLSPRETEVLALLAEGVGNQAIAERLFVSPGTVKRHVHAILAKTGARSRQELVLRFGRPHP